MERLTYVKRPSSWNRGKYPTNYTSRHTFQEVVARLAAYEDTGLGPEEIKVILERYRAFRSAISDETGQPMVSWTRAGEICRADKDGRLVVLPCKVGDFLYEVDIPKYGVITCKVSEIHTYFGPLGHTKGNPMVSTTAVSVEVVDGHGKGSGYTFETPDFWETVFLTREEAEAALKKRKEADDETD